MTTLCDEKVGLRELSKLRWRCRRGLLENDLFIERFFDRFEPTLTVRQAQGLRDLMELSDNDLLDVLLARKLLADVEPDLDRPEVTDIIKMLQRTHT